MHVQSKVDRRTGTVVTAIAPIDMRGRDAVVLVASGVQSARPVWGIRCGADMGAKILHGVDPGV